MATNDPFEQKEGGGNPFARALKSGLVLAPIGLAGYVGYQRIGSNTALNPIAAAKAAAGPGRLGSTGRDVGRSLRAASKNSQEQLLKRANNEIDKLLETDGVQKLFQSIEEQRAVVQSLIDTMDDPSAGMPSEFVLSKRQQLVDIAQNSATTEEAKEIVGSVLRAMNDSNALAEGARTRFASNLREYRKIGPQLAPPVMGVEAGDVFNKIDQGAFNRRTGAGADAARRRYKHLVGSLGDNGSRYVDLVTHGTGDVQQVYARVYSAGTNSQGRGFLGTIPLDLGSRAPGGAVGVRMNEGGTTGYRANRRMVDLEAASRVFKGRDAASVTPAMLRSGNAIIDIEDFFLNNFISKTSNRGRSIALEGGRNAYGAWQRQYLGSNPRLASSGQSFSGASGMISHINQAGSFQHNVASVVNMGGMSKSQRLQEMQNLSIAGGFETGGVGGRMIARGLEGEHFGVMGLYEGSSLQALQSTSLRHIRSAKGGIGQERGMFPVTSRIEQVTGRESMFVGQGAGFLSNRGGFTAGPTSVFGADKGTTRMVNKNIEWAGSVTGGTNKAVVLDVLGGNKLYDALAGTGAAYHQGVERVRTAFTKPVLDPSARGAMGSKFMNELLSSVKQGELMTLSRSQIQEYGGYLGIGPSKLQFMRDDPRTASMRVGYNVTDVGGKKHINIVGDIDRNLETFKGFSTLHKGTLQSVSDDAIGRFLDAGTRGTLKGLDLSKQHTVYAAGDMLKKGAGFFDLQLTSGFGLVTGDKNYRTTLDRHYGKALKGLGGSHTGRVTSAVIRGLAESKASAAEAGMVLAGIYNRGGKSEWLGGINASQAVERDVLTGAIKTAFGDRASAVIASAAKGVAIGATTMTQGAGVGDWGLGRGSVEPRFFSTMTHRLRRMGLSTGQTSDFLSSIYRNKIAYADHLTSSQGMLKLAESVAGLRGATDVANMLATGVPSYGLSDIQSMSADIKTKGLSSFMAQHKDGFMLDLTAGANAPASRAVASAATDVFKQGQIFIPGSEVLGAMRGTTIKTATGNIAIEDEYSRMVGNFIEDVATLSTSTDRAKAEAASSMQVFKQNVMDMTGKVIHQVTGGKVRGLQSQVAALYDLNNLSNFSTAAKGQLATGIFKKTHGMAVFQDAQGFLSQLGDFMGGTLSSRDAATKAEMFFTGLEGGGNVKDITHRAKGIVSVASRHPLLSLGNVAAVQSFRHVEETGLGASDAMFKAFTSTAAGAEYRDVAGFAGVRSMGATDRTKFFTSMVDNLSDFVGTGGGQLFIPRRMEDVHYTGTTGNSLSVDMGISGAAIGDFDGDQWQMLMTSQKSGRSIMSTLSAKSQWLTDESVYKIKSELFTEEAKAGLKQHTIDSAMPDFAGVGRIRENMMKEFGAKDYVGQLDVRLNKIRTAILDMSMDNPKMASQAEEALALLKVTQEHAVIKGKKLPVFRAFAEMLGGAVDTAFEGRGIGSFTDVMRTEIFPKSKLWRENGGVSITGMAAGATENTRNAVGAMRDQPIVLDDTIDFIDRAINRARVTGVSDSPSQARLSMGLGSDNIVDAERNFNAIRGMVSQQGGVIGGFGDELVKNVGASIENTFASIRAAAGRMDSKTTGLLAMGTLAAMGAGALVSNEGYGASPIVGDMEPIGAAMRSDIASGNLLGQQGGSGPSPEQMQQQLDPYAMMGRPVNTPTTYMNKGSSYQVRGQINGAGGGGFSMINNYMNNLGGGSSGSIRINDARRPITQNYTDRILGDY